MSESLLKVNDLSVTFQTQSGDIAAVRNVSFEINKGENVAIVGESGSGKSVTALSILKLHDGNVIYPSGNIHFHDQDLMQLDEDAVRETRGKNISMIFQEPMTSLNPVYPVGKQIEEVLLLHVTRSKTEAREKALHLLDRVGIPDPENRVNDFPHMLSGGQRQRVMIAMALACDPDLLIADEPTTALDVTIQQQILDLLLELQKENGMSVLLITHDLNLVRRFASRVCVMQEGKIVEQGETSAIFNNAQHDYTQYLLDSEPNQRITEITPSEQRVLSADNVQCHFPVKKGFFRKQVDVVKAVDDVSIVLHKGETLGIVGESGSGKTTLGMSLLRLNKSSGRIKLNDHVISDYSEQQIRPLRKHFQIVFQDPFSSLSPRMTVDQIISEGLELHCPEMSHADRNEKIMSTLEEVGLERDVLWRYPHEFSGGQRQRIAIARVIVLEPEVILLDEPTSALDVSVQKQVLTLLSDLQKKHQLSYLFISHDLRVVRAMSHRVIVMRNGQIVESGDVEQVFDHPEHAYTRELAAASIYTQ